MNWFREWLYRKLFVKPLVWTSYDEKTGTTYLLCNKRISKRTKNLIEQAWREGNRYDRITD